MPSCHILCSFFLPCGFNSGLLWLHCIWDLSPTLAIIALDINPKGKINIKIQGITSGHIKTKDIKNTRLFNK